MSVFPEKMVLPLLALAGIAAVNFALSLIRHPGSMLKRKGTMADFDGEEAEDRISQLPDDVLCSVIQRLHIKDFFRTSTLSRRWKNVCARIPDIKIYCVGIFGETEHDSNHFRRDMNNKTYKQYMYKFVKGVGGLLCLYAGAKLHSFHLSCCFPGFCSTNLERWIRSVGKLGVESLSLNFRCFYRLSDPVHKDFFTFQCRLLSETPLVENLHLLGCSLEPNFKSPCNSLKILHLDYAFVEAKTLQSILSSCLSLHSLELSCCKLPRKLCIFVPESPLKSLKIICCSGLEEIEILASNLHVFEFSGLLEPLIKFSVASVPKLENVRCRWDCPIDVFDTLGEIGRSLPHVKSLVIQGYEFQEGRLSIRENHYKLIGIRHLTLSVFTIFGSNMTDVAAVLDACPFLESFKFMSSCGMEDKGQVKMRSKRHTHLKEVEVWGFEGTDSEIEFALYILRGAVVLQQMSIYNVVKEYRGGDRWSERMLRRWSEETQKIINERLQGQAVSDSAKFIVRG